LRKPFSENSFELMKEFAKIALQTDKVYDPAKHKGLLTVEYGATSTVSIESIIIQSE
jgi:hypothetical protein